jgi:serine/threonine-protein phosphatase 6 catalytic subunit
MSKGDVD